MESEKVKEIKKLIDCDKKQNEIGGIIVVNRRFLMEVLNLINELESENERLRLERDVLIGKKIAEKQKSDKALIMKIDIQEQLKDRIAELEKENATKTDTIVDLLNKQEIYEKEKLTKFAERLKRKAIRKQEYVGGVAIGDIEYVPVKSINQALKEFINKGDEEQ